MQNSAGLGSSGMTSSVSSEMFHSATPHDYEPEPARNDDDFPFAAAVARGDGGRPPAPEPEYEPEYEPAGQGARLADDPSRQMHEDYRENPRGSTALSASLPSPPEMPFVNNPERWQRQQELEQLRQEEEARRRASQGAGGGGERRGSFDSRWVEDVSRLASEKGEQAVEGAMWGGREVYRRYRAGEITQEVVCVGVAMLVFAWFMYWLVWQLHWSLRWVLMVILILFTLRTCCGITDIDRWVLEPMHREFPELTESIMRFKRSAELKVHQWRGGRAAQMSQGIYADGNGSDEEDAPLLSRSGQGETPQEELERLRRERLMTSQEIAQLREENELLKSGGAGGGVGRGFDTRRGDQMEEL
jgi:hypothetical protein